MGRVTTRVPRTRWDVAAGARLDRPDTVAVEEPLEIRVGDAPLTTTMRTPGDDFDLALGHLLTEGLLHAADEVATLMHCTDVDATGSPTYNVVEATLARGRLHRPARERTESMTSACGVCGSASIEAVRTTSRYCRRRRPARRPPRRRRAARGAARRGSRCSSGPVGVHAAGLATASGELILVREDVGRHNAVDKVVGARPASAPCPWPAPCSSSALGRASRSCRRRASPASRPSSPSVPPPRWPSTSPQECGITLVAFTAPPLLGLRRARTASPG